MTEAGAGEARRTLSVSSESSLVVSPETVLRVPSALPTVTLTRRGGAATTEMRGAEGGSSLGAWRPPDPRPAGCTSKPLVCTQRRSWEVSQEHNPGALGSKLLLF